jgi:hypothetical protein
MREKIRSSKGAEEALGRMQEHLSVNGVDLGKTPPTMGEFLEMDPATERFTNNREADALLIRNYRRPFVVPQKV